MEGRYVTSDSQPATVCQRHFLFFLLFFPLHAPTPPSPSPHSYLGTLYTRVGRLTGKEPEAWMRERGVE